MRKDNKTINYIGITSLSLSVLDYVIQNSNIKIDTVLTYCNYNLHCELLQNYSSKWIKKGITIIQGGVSSMGLLTNKGPPSWHPASNELKLKCKEVVNYCNNNNLNITKLSYQLNQNNNHIHSILVGPITENELLDYYNWSKDEYDTVNINNIIQKFNLFQKYMWIESGSEENIIICS